MGYETRLIIAEKGNAKKFEDYVFAVAEYDLCKVYGFNNKLQAKNYPVAEYRTYSLGSNEPIEEDCYGAKLLEIPVKDCIELLKEAQAEEGGYRRFQPCISLLEGFNLDEWNNLVVLLYGH